VTGDVDDAALRRYAGEHLAAYKRPKEFHLVDVIPRVGLSKLRRSNLAADLGLDPLPGCADP
jgi:acyl-CoA synthetase (AMP-forming)/AMP-acid ligase II